MNHVKFLRGAVALTVGGLIAKCIGALYRIPLANLLGGYGMGLYQMAYPLFLVLLTFSSTGIPSAFSRIIARETARGEENGQTVKTALALFALLGAAGTVIMLLLAPLMSALQGDGALLRAYAMLAPSVFFVALLAVFRGYFQGKGRMAPTAVSEVIEQLVKAGAGLFFAYRYRSTPDLAAAYALLAVTASEFFALVAMAIRYRRDTHVRKLRVRTPSGTEILSLALPVMAAASVLPFSQTADSVLVVRLLSAYEPNAVAHYGYLSGGAASLVGLAATLCYGLAAASVPAVSAACAEGNFREAASRSLTALAYTLLLAVPCALGLFFLAKTAVALLFPSLPPADAALLVRLVRASAVSAVFLSCVETLAACLTGMGRAKYAAWSMLIAVCVKFVLEYFLVSDPRFGILGAAIASDACYLIAFFLDLRYTLRKRPEGKKDGNSRRTRNKLRGSDGAGASGALIGRRSARAHGRSRLGEDA